QAEDGIRALIVTGVQTCALPILALDSNGFPVITFRSGTGSSGCNVPGYQHYRDDLWVAHCTSLTCSEVLHPFNISAQNDAPSDEIGRASCRGGVGVGFGRAR